MGFWVNIFNIYSYTFTFEIFGYSGFRMDFVDYSLLHLTLSLYSTFASDVYNNSM